MVEMEEPRRAWAVWSFGLSPVRKARIYCLFLFPQGERNREGYAPMEPLKYGFYILRHFVNNYD